ncbi:hypothetical protein EMIHUDRAFT_110549 [Emiliania huxleyi CCMP1516]|uniref:Amino acid transporter transmembrane domain-containing protein n=2 Tax=Emiliania huxleyi TaxID=2903 RepID=A0A0D3KJL8_EMIH1|nr:hypothetical protein EMIHUDRAFT_110549 [Emiliania huxleyi CCMP1516]EOD35953.1 hypothetical protein EMIHUDRAFT_110549 [Emiliania huxleyi CCMP1516]|eukprot:XP_005788382.1 hypothetical protein EMIHUDRAFT_110549 [Emiliania huxleyi CCMP1516]
MAGRSASPVLLVFLTSCAQSAEAVDARSVRARPRLSPRCAAPALVAGSGAKTGPADGGRAASPVQQHRSMSLVDAIAIIGGSAVGGGFLAVPAVTAPLGLLPSASAMVATWVYLVLSGLAYVDAACMSEGIDTDGASVLAISRRCFGNGVAALFSLLFVAQMLAIVSANLVKAAELSASLLPRLPFPAAVLLAAAGFGAFVFGAAPATVAAANTLLAGCMLTGFLTLFALAAAAPAPAAAAAVAAPSVHWAGLLPRRGWPIPIFVNTLRFGEAIPARLAVVLGSLLPLLLAIGWSSASAALASLASPSPPGADPVLALLGSSPTLATPASTRCSRDEMPVALIAVGAIGSTMLPVLLACAGLLADASRSRSSSSSPPPSSSPTSSSPRLLAASRAAVVAVPAAFACLGPSLYLRLLAFSGAPPLTGAFPTVVLYGLLPPLAALVLRRRHAFAHAAGRGVHSPTAAAVARPGSAPHPPPAGEAKGSAPRLPSASLVGLVGLSALLLLVSAGVACGVWPG